MAEVRELQARIGRVEGKLDALTHAVSSGFVEQREYTEFAFERLRTEMIGRFEAIDKRFTVTDARFDRMDARFDRLDARFDRLERKLDQFIDTQSRTNALVEHRLRFLEPPGDSP